VRGEEEGGVARVRCVTGDGERCTTIFITSKRGRHHYALGGPLDVELALVGGALVGEQHQHRQVHVRHARIGALGKGHGAL
jgi:hypothetical protein